MTTSTAVTSGMTGKRRVYQYEIMSARTTVGIRTAVAVKSPAFSPASRCGGRTRAAKGAKSFGRALAKKKRKSGPSSSVSFKEGGIFARSAGSVIHDPWTFWALSAPAPSQAQAQSFEPGDGARKIARIERLKIFGALADADEMDRQVEFLGYGDENSAARSPVELGHDEARHSGAAAENLDLRQRILSDRRVEHEENGVRGRRIELLHYAHDLFEFGHQLGSVLQPPGRVHDQNVGARLARALKRIISEACRIRAALACNDFAAEPLAPDLQLFDGSGAKSVAGDQHHALAFVSQSGSELADRRGLARAIDADHEDDERPARDF